MRESALLSISLFGSSFLSLCDVSCSSFFAVSFNMLRTNIANSERYEGLKSPSERNEEEKKYEKVSKISKTSNRVTFKFFKWLAYRSGIEKFAVLAFLATFVRLIIAQINLMTLVL